MKEMINLQRAVVEVFGGCNFSCEMCPQSTGRGSNWTRKMPLDMFENILDQLPGKPVIQLEGSGEPSMAKDLPMYVEACARRGLKSYMFTNGSMFVGDRMKDSIDAGLSFVRFSCIGYDRETYKKWMSKDLFNHLMQVIRDTKEYIDKGSCDVSIYHLILDDSKISEELKHYQRIAKDLDIKSYVWKMHNWSGNYSADYDRSGVKKKTCGRPFADEITIRAGGLDGKQGAVTPCCQTMGPPNEDLSVLGHFEDQTFDEIWGGQLYENLRESHRSGDWPEYCKNCDFLIDDPEVLLWTNDPDHKINSMLGTKLELR